MCILYGWPEQHDLKLHVFFLSRGLVLFSFFSIDRFFSSFEFGSPPPKRFDWILEKLIHIVRARQSFCVRSENTLRILIENGIQFDRFFLLFVHLWIIPCSSPSKCHHHFQRVLNCSDELAKKTWLIKGLDLW